MRLAMASLETLPADQRAVLQMVLGRGRGYEEIGKMLSIDRAGVRDRALAALDALGPETSVPARSDPFGHDITATPPPTMRLWEARGPESVFPGMLSSTKNGTIHQVE